MVGWVLSAVSCLRGCNCAPSRSTVNHTVRVVTTDLSGITSRRICGSYFSVVSLAALGASSAPTSITGLINGIGTFGRSCPS